MIRDDAKIGKASLIAILLILFSPFLAIGRSVALGALLPQTNWQVWYVDSEETVGENGVVENAFDGNPNTFWHTQWYGSSPPPPHELQIDLGGNYTVGGFRYLPRQDGEVNGGIAKYEFYVSADGTNWGTAVATGTFAKTATEKEVLFLGKPGRFIRLRALSEVNGKAWTSVAELNVLAENIASAEEYVAFGDSITFGDGDNIPQDDTSLDGRNTGGGFEPILNNLLTSAKGIPHSIVNEGFGGYDSLDGLAVLPTVLARHPNATYYLILFGTNDADPFFPNPSGLGLIPGQPGYNGSYKDNMQRMINAVKSAGKIPYLAKVPYSLDAARIAKILEYNQVIVGLVADNGIPVTPPDFYSWFQAHQDQFADLLHPNGVGYQSMANLWKAALVP